MAGQSLVPKGAKVCIVGGGTTGILAAKNTIEAGLIPTVFERSWRVGGVWRLDDAPRRVAYESLYTNSSGRMMNISDFPLDPSLQDAFPRRQDICDHYERYVEFFELASFLRFGCDVVSIARNGKGDGAMGKWSVKFLEAGEERQDYFDAVFLCCGQFQVPKLPQSLSSELRSFEGRWRHSASYRCPADLGQRVLIVGFGNSALDIALEAARAKRLVTILCRTGAQVIPVADFHGRPVDQMLNTRLFNALPRMARNLLFLRMVSGTKEAFQRHGMPTVNSKNLAFTNLKDHVAFREMLASGQIRIAEGEIQKVSQKAVLTSKGEEVVTDEIIFCTGYQLSFPFLAEPVLSELLPGGPHLNAYRLIMHPKEPTLCALGFLLTFGNESAVGEMQARWALALWTGRAPRPSEEKVEADLQRRRKAAKYPHFVPYISYMDTLAQDCGEDPMPWSYFWRNPKLFFKLFASPASAVQYRLRSWARAADFLESQPVSFFRWFDLALRPPDAKGAKPAARPNPAARL